MDQQSQIVKLEQRMSKLERVVEVLLKSNNLLTKQIRTLKSRSDRTELHVSTLSHKRGE